MDTAWRNERGSYEFLLKMGLGMALILGVGGWLSAAPFTPQPSFMTNSQSRKQFSRAQKITAMVAFLACEVFTQNIVLQIIFSILISVLVLRHSEAFARFLGAPNEETAGYVVQYCRKKSRCISGGLQYGNQI